MPRKTAAEKTVLHDVSRIEADIAGLGSLSRSELVEQALTSLQQRIDDFLRIPASDAIRHASAQARQRGIEAKVRLFEEGEVLTSSEVAKRFQLSKPMLTARAQTHEILALPHPTLKNRLGYPAWQFEEGIFGAPLRAVLMELKDLTPWDKWYFFITDDVRLEGLTPVDVLQAATVENLSMLDRERLERVRTGTRHGLDQVVEAAGRYARFVRGED